MPNESWKHGDAFVESCSTLIDFAEAVKQHKTVKRDRHRVSFTPTQPLQFDNVTRSRRPVSSLTCCQTNCMGPSLYVCGSNLHGQVNSDRTVLEIEDPVLYCPVQQDIEIVSLSGCQILYSSE